jgi:hypothetical protein
MKVRIVILLLAAIPGSCSLLRGQDKGFGLGALFGEPTGVSMKYWVSQQNAIDAGLAWSFSGKGFFHIHSDFLWHFPDVARSEERFVLFAGVGGRIRFADPARVGARFPLGIEWWPRQVPLDVFLELVPILDLSPSTKFEFNGGIGARYFFE